MKNVSKIYPLINNRMKLKLINRLNIFCDASYLKARNSKQATLNFGVIISIWIFHISPLSTINLKNVTLVILDSIL
jgi:hypothetical protein